MPEIQDYEKRSPESVDIKRRLQRIDIFAVVASLISLLCALVTLFPALASLSGGEFSDSRRSLLASMLIVYIAYIIFAFILIHRRMHRRRRYRMRISLTGRPRVGKTVFSVLLYYIISSSPPEDVEFSGETDNIIKMFRMLKGFDLGDWPVETSADGVSVVKGELSRHTKYSGSSIYEISIADTAGENWASLEETSSSERPYLTLVASSDALVHVVSVPELRSVKSGLVDDVSDLEMAAKLISNSRRGAKSAIPLLVVFSKFDGEAVRHSSDCGALFRVFDRTQIVQEREIKDEDIVSYVNNFSERLSSEFVIRYTVSSALQARNQQLSSDLVKWLMLSAE